MKSAEYFRTNLADRHTNRQTHKLTDYNNLLQLLLAQVIGLIIIIIIIIIM